MKVGNNCQIILTKSKISSTKTNILYVSEHKNKWEGTGTCRLQILINRAFHPFTRVLQKRFQCTLCNETHGQLMRNFAQCTNLCTQHALCALMFEQGMHLYQDTVIKYCHN